MTVAIDLAKPETWPVRMTIHEIAAVLRISKRSMYERIQAARFPKSDDGRTWSRDVVIDYAKRMDEYEAMASKVRARQSIAMVGGRR